VEYFTVSHRTKNNGIHHVLPTKEGVVDVTVTLEKVGNDKLGYLTNFKPITVTEEVVIAKRVRIIPDLTKLLLPYDPEARHSYQLAAEGGSRQYIWSSSNSSTVSVNAQGMVVSHRPGTATIKVADERDPYNRDQIDVVVAVPKVITFANGPREAEVDTSLVLAITMYDNDASGQTFHNCSALPLTWNISIAEIFANPVQVPCSTFPGGAPPKACACASVVALKEGQARAHVTYLGFGPEVDINNLPSKEERELLHKTLPERTASITANTQIAAFRGLRVSPPSILVTFGASYPLSVSGGPQPWQYQQTLSPLIRPEKTSSVEVAHPTNPSGLVGGPSLFPITCLKLDEQVIHVSVGNPASFSNMQPVKVTRNVLFRCENPHKLFVFPNLRDGVVAERGDIANDVIITSTSSCAEGEIPDLRTLHTLAKEDRFRVLPTKYKLRNNRSVPFNLTIFNENGHLFDNFTSLLVDWHISNESLVTFAPTTDPLEAKTHRILNLAALEGVVRIRVSIRGYDHSVIGKLNAPAFPEYLKLTQEFELTLSHNVRFDPPQISLYNHPLNKINLVTLSGSGYNQISVNDSSIASVNATVGDSNIIVIPRHPGVLRITATDICLTGSDLASAIVRVSDIHSINLKAADMVKVGDREIMEVEILDSMGNPFDASQHRFIEYKIHVEGTALEVEKDKETKLQIIGRHVGVSTVSVSVTNIVSGVLVSSLPLQVHVYPNLRVWPRKLELLPNATFQLTTSGGPPFRSEISYQIEDVEIASVSNNGFVTARKIGSSTIKVSAYLTDASGFNKRVVDFGLVELEVKLLRGIRVHASTTRVLVGEEITLRVEGLDGETPFAWGNLNVQFHWDVLNPEVLSLLPVYEKANVSLDEERGFSVRVRGKAPGLTRISVKVEHGPESMHLQTASITFEVVQVLALAGSEIGEGFRSWQAQRSLLLAPGARYRLSPNVPQVRYTLIDHCASVAISSESDREVDIGQVVDLDPKNPGLIQSNGVAGHAIIHAKERRDGQVALIKVSVKPVHHLELRARTPVYSNLPVGTIMEFDIVLRDELGQEFDSYDGVEFEFYMNNQASLSSEIVRTNSTHRHQLRVKGLRPGKVFMLLKVSSFGQATDATRYDGSFQRNLQHFQFLEVSNAILPWLPALHVGAEVTFSTSFIPDKSYRRIWSSDNEAIIKIDAETGVAVAGAVPGSAFVKHQSSVFTGTTVTVARVSFVELNSDSCVVLSQERNVTCVIGVRFFDASRNELRDIAGVIRQNINYQCATNFPALVKAEPFFDSSTNTFGCKLISLERGDRLETIPDKIVLRVTALSGQQNVVGEQVVTFATSFAIQGHGSQINIPSGQATYRIDIKSSSPLRAHSRDSTRLTVREVDFNSATFTHTFEFMVLDPSTPFASIAVEFAARDTNQVETVYVSYARGSRRPSESGWVYPIVSIITIGSVALCAIYFTYSYMMSTQTPARPEERPQPVSSPLGATPRLPLPSPAAFQHNQGSTLFATHSIRNNITTNLTFPRAVNSPFVPIHRRSDYIAPLSPPRTPYGGGY
jgi:nuclear pore complex protein Nup210